MYVYSTLLGNPPPKAGALLEGLYMSSQIFGFLFHRHSKFSSNGTLSGTLCQVHSTLILPCFVQAETWSLNFREEHRLSMLENSMVRKIFWPRRDEVTGVEKAVQ
jgi:hypothetical protein